MYPVYLIYHEKTVQQIIHLYLISASYDELIGHFPFEQHSIEEILSNLTCFDSVVKGNRLLVQCFMNLMRLPEELENDVHISKE